MMKMRKIIITGAKGQLGQSLNKLIRHFPDFEFINTDQAELDITNLEEVRAFIGNNPAYALINCAAYTAVDKAEEEEELAFLINEKGPHNLAIACRETKTVLIHISTDYVFSGQGFRPYPVDTEVKPESVYGRSKAAGENAIQKINPAGCIIRTSWLYSEYGQNFVKTMLRLGHDRNELNVIADQIGTPTYASDFADAILKMLSHPEKKFDQENGTSLYHYSNTGCASWFDFTIAIIEIAGLDCKINPIPTENYPLPAKRPFYSVLNTDTTKDQFGLEIPYWRSSLTTCIKEIIKNTE
jgi:dTDP-4-dehydrorhamnose reductase